MGYDPLLAKGVHELTLEEVHTLCVDAFFPNNDRREHLFVQLTDFLIYFRGLGFLPAGIWIDGSFVTQKIDPGDIDLLITLNMGEVVRLPREVRDRIHEEFGSWPEKKRFECDVHISPSTDNERIDYGLNLFRNLSARNTLKKKGVIKLKMP